MQSQFLFVFKALYFLFLSSSASALPYVHLQILPSARKQLSPVSLQVKFYKLLLLYVVCSPLTAPPHPPYTYFKPYK